MKLSIKKQKKAIATEMVEGRMSDLSAYHRNVGVAEGLEQACDIIDETLKNINEGDD
jgi:hypothetical protein